MRIHFAALIVAAVCLAGAQPARSAAVTLDFEGLPELTEVGNVYAGLGLAFQGAAVLTAPPFGSSLNDVDFPPRSGSSVAANIDISTLSPTTVTLAVAGARATSFDAWFTYADGVDLTFYDGLTVVGIASRSGNNFGSNERITFQLSSGFNGIAIGAANLFTIDDVALELDSSGTVVPEPGSLLLCAASVPVLALWLRRRSSTAKLP